MRISLNWLKELVDISLTPEELAETLTNAGFEVEDIEDRRTWAEGVVVGRVVQCNPHPNADKLRVCQVDIGQGELSTIVCGAANVHQDAVVPVATLGTFLPKVGDEGLKIRPAKLRGVDSAGMICSLAELGLEKQSAGIHLFEMGTTIGADVRPLLGLDDVVLDVTSTANRADALSMVGLAREVAALTGANLHLPTVAELISSVSTDGAAIDLNLRIQEPQACPTYIGTVIEGVKIQPSPLWLQRRLQAAGIRAINNVVDVTNYILLEWGQPLHAFDADRLLALNPQSDSALTIGVRFAAAGESLQTLDGQSRTLQSSTLLITAYNQPVALAGVMGGATTEVHAETTRLLLEAAVFDGATTRRSARSQGLRTEASIRYERGVNRAELAIACQRAVQLIGELAGGAAQEQKVASAVDSQSWVRTLELRLDRVNQLLGEVQVGEELAELQAADVERTLTALGCTLVQTEQAGVWSVTVPPYRYRDLEREVDLIEEVARLYGYNNFSETLPTATEFGGYLSLEQVLQRRVREAWRAAGLTEVMHYSLVKAGGDRQVILTNPLFVEYSALRTELLAGLLDAYQYNLEQGNGPLYGFEIGRVFWQDEMGLAEKDALAGIMGGDILQGRWNRSGREQLLTWFEAKGILESAFRWLGLAVEYQPDRSDVRLHPGRTASLWLGGHRLGTFGQIHPKLQIERGLPHAIYVFELDLEILLDRLDEVYAQPEDRSNNLPIAHSPLPRFRPYSTYPASDRDIAFFAPVNLSVVELERVMIHAGQPLLTSVELFDEYRGDHVPPGKRSLAFRLVYRADDRTLTDTEVETAHQKVREALGQKFQLDLRS